MCSFISRPRSRTGRNHEQVLAPARARPVAPAGRRPPGPVTAQPQAVKAAARPVIASRAPIAPRVAPTAGRADAAHAIAWRSGALAVAAIARRELTALIVSPVGWVVAAI